jgi:hypothetical protein
MKKMTDNSIIGAFSATPSSGFSQPRLARTRWLFGLCAVWLGLLGLRGLPIAWGADYSWITNNDGTISRGIPVQVAQ